MTGDMSCSSNELKPGSSATLFTREIVLVAKMTEDGGVFTMEQNDPDWTEAISYGYAWFDESRPSSRAGVQYRVPFEGQVQVQWARIKPWLDEGFEKALPVERRVTYKMRFAVAEVERSGDEKPCEYVQAGEVLSLNDTFAGNPNASWRPDDPSNWAWIHPMISSWAGGTREGIGSTVRVAMAILISGYDTNPFDFLSADSRPFGPEDTSNGTRKPIEYPFLEAYGWREIGTTTPMASIFTALGCFSIIVVVVRVRAGPPILTSWMAQHTFLTQSGAVSLTMPPEDPATGYKATNVKLGRLILPKGGGSG
ncbi:hypothetical protein B0T10DRAFT_581244 [Thelonectria olida]|uniref:Uncharacterized protein n=1 Tax=Thelonectria olida TaxID=1576542 RepID=A0A9P8VX83_9HYPO|nr:hypothetical protein B0T10DRAFT_581244 [Thelonectria olida]